jgi:hypothetical protein
VKQGFCIKQQNRSNRIFFAELKTFFLPLCLINQTIGFMQQSATTKAENIKQIMADE